MILDMTTFDLTYDCYSMFMSLKRLSNGAEASYESRCTTLIRSAVTPIAVTAPPALYVNSSVSLHHSAPSNRNQNTWVLKEPSKGEGKGPQNKRDDRVNEEGKVDVPSTLHHQRLRTVT